MRVKKFQAKDMADAMRMVRAELGPDAVILHSRDVRRGLLGWFSSGGVEVTAGVDRKEPAKGNGKNGKSTPNSSRSPAGRGQKLDVKVQDPPVPPLHDDPLPLLTPGIESNPLLQTPPPTKNNSLLELSKKIVAENAPEKPVSPSLPSGTVPPHKKEDHLLDERLSNLESRLIKLTGLIENLAPSLASGEVPAIPSHTRELYNHLLDQDVDERLALSIASQIAETTDAEDDVWTALKSYLVSTIPVASPIELKEIEGRPKILMLVGPTGVGKTTTLAKISAQYRYSLDTQKRPKIVFITADLYRLAAVEQLQKYTEILGVELEVTYSPDEVRKALAKHKHAHLILFDTAGTCQRNLPQMSTLGSIVEASKPDEVHLVVSATTKYSDMIDIVEHFKEIHPTRLLFTKIDESTTYGPMLNTVMKFKMPISYVTTGQNVPEDIEKARPERIAKLLLTKPTVNRSIENPLSPLLPDKSKKDMATATKTGLKQTDSLPDKTGESPSLDAKTIKQDTSHESKHS